MQRQPTSTSAALTLADACAA